MTSIDIQKTVRCGSCHGQLDRVNLCALRYRAQWQHPTSGNVLTGETDEAVAFLCDRCIERGGEIVEAVEFAGQRVIYHDLSELERLGPRQTYYLTQYHGAPVIVCLICGTSSLHPSDVANQYCGKCQRFHPITEPGEVA